MRMGWTITTHRIAVEGWRPALVNELVGVHWAKAAKFKRLDRQMIAVYAHKAGIPRATGRRRVSLEIAGPWRGRTPDPDNCWKSVLDACVAAGLLLDDTASKVEMGPVTF